MWAETSQALLQLPPPWGTHSIPSFHFSKKWHMGESDGIRLSFGYRNMARNGIFPCGDS